MQKYFLRGLAVAAVSISALSVKADGDSGPKVKMAGNLAVNAFGAQQKVRTAGDTTLGTAGELRGEVGAKAKNGVNYGMVAAINLDNQEVYNRIKAAYFLVNHENYGEWLFGDADSASHLMGYSGEDLMAGLGGPTSSSFDKVINVTGGVSMKNNMATRYSNATKVTYMSPIKDGFRVGFSFTPNESFTGMATRTNRVNNIQNNSDYKTLGKDSIYAVNALEGTVSYTHQLNTGGRMADVNWYVGGKMARAKATQAVTSRGVRPVRAMQAGVVLDYSDYQVGGGYYNNGRSFMRKDYATRNWTNLEGFNVAIGKKLDSIPGAYLSLGHTGSRRRVTNGYARGNVTSLGADYDIAKGLVVYTSVDMFDFKSPKAHQQIIGTTTQYDYLDNSSSKNTNNRGALFVVGAKIRV